MDKDTSVAHERGPFLVLGLGNPGDRYRQTRHNVGFQVVEILAARRDLAFGGEVCGALLAEREDLCLALPQTFMNRSGHAARCLSEREGFQPRGILVVVDDVNLALGRLRIRRRGSAGGHRGLESVMESLGTDDFARLRLGVGASGEDGDLVEHVLGPFQDDELETVEEMVRRAADACEVWLREGVDEAMNKFNC